MMVLSPMIALVLGADNAADADNRVNAAAYDAVDASNGGVGARNSVRPDL